jgi:2'-5' RNA ligase
MQGVGFTDEVDPDQARAIADAASERLAKLPPVELTFHQSVIRPEALALSPTPTQAVATIRDTIRDGIADVWGNDGVPETGNWFEPHLSLAYVNTDASADAALHALSSVNPNPIQATVNDVSFIVLYRDKRQYRWKTFATVPLSNHT